MRTKVLLLALTLTVVTACKKDMYTTSPQLNFESVNATAIPRSSFLTFKIQVTDKEGDIQDTLWVEQISLNGCTATLISPYDVPGFTATKDLKGEFNITYLYGEIGSGYPIVTGCSLADDTCSFRFWMKDKANHVSDTVSSPTVVLLQ